jgi:vacuolar protein sorting-associated protein 41
LELAYILEHYGDESETEAHIVLNLYMKGAKSMILAVSFAQRNKSYSSSLWKSLIRHCLDKESGKEKHLDGSLFGALLEAAALSGADLAHLVTQIPPGMAIEGLRPRLVAAVADYRLKLKMHETASEGASQEMISLLREVSHRSRRGARYQLVTAPQLKSFDIEDGNNESVKDEQVPPKVLSSSLRTVIRQDRRRLGIAPPLK